MTTALAGDLGTSILTHAEDLRRLEPAWRALLEDSTANEPTLSPEWVLAWWEVYGGDRGRRLRCLRIDEDDELLGLGLFSARIHWYAPGLPFRRLEALGSGEREADSVCSDYLNVIARCGREAEVARRFVEALGRNELGAWDELVIPFADGDGAMTGLLRDEAMARGWYISCEETTRAPYAALPPTWAAYLKALDQKDRYVIARTLRDFDAWAGGEAQLHRATDEAGLRRGQEVLRTLHQERWGEGAGTFRSPRFLAFHDRVMPALLARGALELLWLTVRGEPIAAMYDIRWNGKVYFYQCGRATEVPPKIRPGGVLMAKAMQAAIADGLREFDFLGGESRYKRQLANASRPLVTIRIARPGLLERGRRLAERVKDRLRPHWRRWRGKGSVPKRS